MRKKARILMMAGVMAFSFAACAKNPEKSVVREKNMDKMIDEARATDDADSYEQVKGEMKEYEKYKTKLQNKKLNVTVNVDAKVEIPDVEKLSVYRVSAKKIEQKFLDKIRETLTPGITYYDGSKVQARTKSEIAKEINDTKKDLTDYKKSGDDAMEEETQDILDRLQNEYQNAPDKINITDYQSDNKIQKIKKLYDRNPKDNFYSWLYEVHGNGEVFYGVNDGKDGNYHSLFVQNSGDYGNCLRYESVKSGYSGNITHATVDPDIQSIVPREKNKEPDFSKIGIASDMKPKCVANEPLTLSIEDAQKKADSFIKQTGLEDYACYEKGMYSQYLDTNASGSPQYRDIYRFLYLRKLDHVFVNNQAGFKYTDEWQGSEYTKKMWESEAVAIAVNDSGIVGFYYLSPLSIDKTVVKQSKIKSFREIKDTFEQMVLVENAVESSEGEKNQTININVTDVRLAYTRISEKDSFDTGLVIPVWDFEGTIEDELYAVTGEKRTGNILSINAIDGSVINRELGY